MKVKLSLKDPDGVYESVKDAVQETLPDGLSEDEAEDLLKRAPRRFVWTPGSKSPLVVEPCGHVGRLHLSLSTCPQGGC